MKKKLRLLIMFGCNLFFIAACSAACNDVTTHVGGKNRLVIVSTPGQPDTYTHVNGNGDATHPCGTTIHGQIQQ